MIHSTSLGVNIHYAACCACCVACSAQVPKLSTINTHTHTHTHYGDRAGDPNGMPRHSAGWKALKKETATKATGNHTVCSNALVIGKKAAKVYSIAKRTEGGP